MFPFIPSDELILLRKRLHELAERPGYEHNTADHLKKFLKKTNPDLLYKKLGGHGLAAVFKGRLSGPVLMFRAEMDAVPVGDGDDENTDMESAAHVCGHDGHMAILCGLATILSGKRPDCGDIVLLFQPSEENGEGAAKVLLDPQFGNITPDNIIALHNMPGYPQGAVISRSGVFASASLGIIIHLKGEKSHASEPEKGVSPAAAIAEMLLFLNEQNESQGLFSDFTLVTPVCVRMGEPAFGITPSSAVIMATLRAFNDEDLEKLRQLIEAEADTIAIRHSLSCTIKYSDVFPATINHSFSANCIEQAAKDEGLEFIHPDKPFRWAEDFGKFTALYDGALFGLGSGEKHPNLHNEHYEFNDALIEDGVRLLYRIACNMGMFV